MTAAGACTACRSPKAPLECGICHESLCKACDQLGFTDLATLPPEIQAVHACSVCMNETIEPAIASYAALLERARGVYVFTTNQRKPLPILKRAKEFIETSGHADKDEATMALAIRAVRDGYNALIESEIVSSQVRNEGYQKKSWRAKARPAEVDAAKVERQAAQDDLY